MEEMRMEHAPLSAQEITGELMEDSLAGLIRTGISSHPTLYDLFVGFLDGTLPDAIVVGDGETLGGILRLIEQIWKAYQKGDLNGKSAYDYAVEGGYTGTETEFAEALAKAVEEVTYTVEVEVI